MGTARRLFGRDADIARLGGSPLEIWYAVQLAAHTGLQLGDLLRVTWNHVHDNRIEIATGKSRGRREAIVPLYDVLAGLPKRSPQILTNSRRRPRTMNGFEAAFNRAKRRAGIVGLRFHDLRGTAATRFYSADLPNKSNR